MAETKEGTMQQIAGALRELAAMYAERRRAYDDAAAETAQKKTLMESAKQALAQAMIDAGLEKMTVDGATFTPGRTTYYSCPAASREALLDQLETDGYRGAFTVNPNTLNTIMREMADQTEDGRLPERYALLMHDYPKLDLSVRGLKKRK